MGSGFTIDPTYDPHTYRFACGEGPDSADRKAAPARILYPNLGDYARVAVERYLSPEAKRAEWERLWTRVWNCAGRESDLAEPGSYFRYDLGVESFIVTRGRDTIIRAFYNTCQHRGRRLLDDEFGRRVRFVCPFHGWAYDLAGKNVRVTDRELFSAHALCGDLNLKEVLCDTWAGFVFINMDVDARPLREYLGEIPGLLAAYGLEHMHVVKDAVLTIDCNWKTGIEAFIEAYHIHVTHPQALPGVDDVYEQVDIYPNGHARMSTPFAVPSPRIDHREQINPFLALFLMNAGVDPQTYEGGVGGIRDAILKAKRAPDNRFGLDYSGFTQSQILDNWSYSIYPNLTINAHPEGVLVMRFLPHASDPEKFIYHVHIIIPKLKEGVRLPFYMGVEDHVDISGKTRPKRQYTTMEKPEMGEVLDQDISNLLAVQRGIKSRGFPGGNRYAERELRIQVLHAETDLYLKGLK